MKILREGHIWAFFCGNDFTDKFTEVCDKRLCEKCLLRLADKDKNHRPEDMFFSDETLEIEVTSGTCIFLSMEKEL